ncbi:N-acetylmuramoyl-L-alanine amidase [Saccharopolyspora sp. HNM0983]|uniref:N-acetylmuramoyl-L-alanine amidase n=1 Tax=Saccharopolyspora montiporae TaxID=2781240 RepID=A0A929B9A1_9PSEU|nr:N-acetylmuramoyl-L-alanine amidase [Saccharopolyspora sp. HNM0983]MBE9374626.1 N-acetylmuramoyl-L-alanine amidase [Saccharopolyspora sp. HNM0983]
MALPLEWLGDVLRDAQLAVHETPGWRERSATSGALPEPVGVLVHHTATRSSPDDPAPSVQLCIDGRADLAGPLCHAVIGFDGSVHLIAAGRANHAGQARESGPNPAGDGNTLYIGFELDYQGVDQAPSPEQYAAARTATAAVLGHLGRPPEAARGHRETSVTGKVDPGHIDLDRFRAELAGSGPGGDQEQKMTPEQDGILRRLEHELLGPRGPNGEIQGWRTDVGPRTIVAMLVELVNAQLGGGRAEGAAEGGVDAEAIKRAFRALPPDQAAPLLAELVRIQQERQPSAG